MRCLLYLGLCLGPLGTVAAATPSTLSGVVTDDNGVVLTESLNNVNVALGAGLGNAVNLSPGGYYTLLGSGYTLAMVASADNHNDESFAPYPVSGGGFSYTQDFALVPTAPQVTLTVSDSKTLEEGETRTLTIAGPALMSFTIIDYDAASVEPSRASVITDAGGQATFEVTAADDSRYTGTTDTPTILVHSDLGHAAWVELTVSDDENPPTQLLLSGDTVLAEGQGATWTVSLADGGGTPTALATSTVVTLSSSDANWVGVPASATIPAGATGVTFAVTTGDDAVDGSDHASTISASATGYSGAASGVSVLDDDHKPVVNAALHVLNEDTPLASSVTGSDADGDSIQFAHTQPSNGTISGWNASTGAFTYTPDSDFAGNDSFTATAFDGTNHSSAATISLQVNAINDLPTVADGSGSTDEDTPLVASLAGLGSDVDTVGLTYKKASSPTDGAVVVDGDGGFTYTPTADFSGTDSFTFTANDGFGDSLLAATYTVTVNPIADTPVANAGSGTTDEDTPLVGSVTGSDADGTTPTFALAADGSRGSAVINADGSFTYTPVANQSGADSFTFTATDGGLTSDPATYSVTIVPVNDRPTTSDDSLAVTEDTAQAGTLLGDDVDGDGLTFSKASDPANGTVVVTSDGSFTYTPDADYNGGDSFTFHASDGLLTSDPAGTISVTVAAVNDAPVATADGHTTAEDTALAATVAGSDVDNDSLTFAKVDDPANGTVVIASDGNFTYTPNANHTGPDSFTFTASDASLTSAKATVTITVTAVNDAPTATSASGSTNEDTALVGTLTGVDVDGDSLTFAKAGDPSNGSLTIASNGDFTYTPAVDWSGTDQFQFTVSDGAETSSAATCTVTVNAVNDAPVAANGSATINEDTNLDGTLSGSDVDGDGLTYLKSSDPSNGSLTAFDGAGGFTYAPNADFTGTDSFTFTVFDGTLVSSAATFTVTVNPVDDLPVLTAGAFSGSEDTVLTANLVASDADGDSLTFAVVTPPANGSLALTAGTGAFSFTPDAHWNGSDSFTARVSDGTTTVQAAQSLTLAAVNDAPVANALSRSVQSGSVLVGSVTGTDVDGDGVTFAKASDPTNGTATVGSDGSFTYTPNGGYTGGDSFTFTASDGVLTSSAAQVSVTVTAQPPPPNHPPTVTAASHTTNEDTALTETVVASDVDGDSLTLSLTTAPAHGTLSSFDGVTGDFTYLPDSDWNGSDSFQVTASDGEDTGNATISLTVSAVNDAPVAHGRSLSTSEDTQVATTLTGSDVEGSSLTFSLASQGSKGTAVIAGGGSLTYTPAADQNGSDSFTFVVNDGAIPSEPATVTVTIAAVNDAPLAIARSLVTSEDTPLVDTLTGSDADGDSLTFARASDPSNGTVTAFNSTTGAFTYVPDGDVTGTDSFQFTTSDGALTSAAATITVIVSGLNDAPTAHAAAVTTDEDTPVTSTLTGSDPDGDHLTFASATDPAQGSVSVTAGGEFTYTPAADAHGSDSFTFTVSDGTATSVPATVTVTVNQVNDAPTLAAVNTTTAEDTAVAGTLSGGDVDGDGLTYAKTSGPANGTAAVTAGGAYTYTPSSDFTGTDSFTVTVSDGMADPVAATVAVTVTAVNDAPVATAQSLATSEDTAVTGTLAGSDADGDSLTYAIASHPATGTLTGFDAATGAFTYIPNANVTGSVSFTFTAGDGSLTSSPATVTVTVSAVNDAPQATAAAFAGSEDTALVGSLAGTDVDGDSLTFAKVSDPANGTVTVASDGSFVSMPDTDFAGTDTFAFTVSDGSETSSPATATLTIAGINDNPVANSDSVFAVEGEPVAIVPLGNDSDVDGDPLTVTGVGTPGHGSATTDGTTVTYTLVPSAATGASDAMTYTVSDGQGGSATGSITLQLVGRRMIRLVVSQAGDAVTDFSLQLDDERPASASLDAPNQANAWSFANLWRSVGHVLDFAPASGG